jgi:hypothetical protein
MQRITGEERRRRRWEGGGGVFYVVQVDQRCIYDDQIKRET